MRYSRKRAPADVSWAELLHHTRERDLKELAANPF
jgi:hypothetical protein